MHPHTCLEPLRHPLYQDGICHALRRLRTPSLAEKCDDLPCVRSVDADGVLSDQTATPLANRVLSFPSRILSLVFVTITMVDWCSPRAAPLDHLRSYLL